MSNREFEGQDHAKYYAKYRPKPPQTVIQAILKYLLEQYSGSLGLALDLGCGNGQCTFALKDDFSTVIGMDISPAQVFEATDYGRKMNITNVKFQACPAEKIPVNDNSVQLVTICEAAHWMNLPKVYEEVNRVLVQNGVFAIVGYHLPIFIPGEKQDAEKVDAINAVIECPEVNSNWSEHLVAVESEYADVKIPFRDFIRQSGFYATKTVKIEDIHGSIQSYSRFQKYCADHGASAGEKLLERITNQLTSILNEGRVEPLSQDQIKEYEFTESVKYFVLMARI